MTTATLKRRALVVKIGTSTLATQDGGLDEAYLEDLAGQVRAIYDAGRACVLVSSGAGLAGRGAVDMTGVPRSMALKQATAAIGQGRLMQRYGEAFAKHGLVVAQILLTRDDFDDRKRFVNAANTLRTLIGLGVVPIINENDSVAVDEIKVGDNDTLAALVAGLIDTELLILLSDIEGLFTADPNKDSEATLIPIVTDIKSLRAHIGGSSSAVGTGGMKTKLAAAELCLRANIPMVIAHGRAENVLVRAWAGRSGTRFEPVQPKGLTARKRWIAAGQRSKGSLTIHVNAQSQLISRGRSLLPAGVTAVTGDFSAGELVELIDQSGTVFARGIVNYDHESVVKIMGLRTAQIRLKFGDMPTEEIIHRDNLVVCAPL